MVLVAAGQPIFTDDLWWHLGMGAEYVKHGPWLDADPFLFGAPGPPEPAAWLADVFFHGVHRIGGFQSLRALHVSLVAATAVLAWAMLRRASGSRVFASLGTALFACLAAYRLFQLRPHLFTVLAALVLVRLLVLDRAVPTRGRVAASTLVFAIWANVHGAFVVGLVLLGAATAGAAFGRFVWPRDEAPARWRRLGAALLLGTLAACVTPSGPRFLLLYFTAGAQTPELAVVADEWTPIDLLATPLSNVPPTPLVWGLVWLLVVAVPLCAMLHVVAARRSGAAGERIPGPDPALTALGLASLVGMVAAVRLLWLGVFTLLVVGAALAALSRAASRDGVRTPARVAAALAALACIPGFVSLGDWPMISQGVRVETYARPYSTAKYHAHAVWMLMDTGIEGRVYNEYWMGNFLGYWLAPRLEMFVNGSLNVPKELMQASRDIRARRADGEGRSMSEQLDRHAVDVFLGTGVPVMPPPGRPLADTTRHVQGTPGWVPIFRNLQSAVHLRDAPRNRPALARVRDWYAEQGVPFDPALGFEPLAVVRAAPEWSVAHGLIPVDFAGLEAAARRAAPGTRQVAQDRLASIHALLGDYDGAVAVDEDLLRMRPRAVGVARRLVWSLLQAGRIADAGEAADRLASISPPDDAFSHRLVEVVRTCASASEGECARIRAFVPVFTRPQGQWALSGFVPAEPRPGRR